MIQAVLQIVSMFILMVLVSVSPVSAGSYGAKIYCDCNNDGRNEKIAGVILWDYSDTHSASATFNCKGDEISYIGYVGNKESMISKMNSLLQKALTIRAIRKKVGDVHYFGSGYNCSNCQLGKAFCPDCSREELDRYIGRLKGLREAADAHRRALRKATQSRDGARDSIFGARGSAAGSLKAFVQSLPGAGKVGEAAPWILAAIDAGSKGDFGSAAGRVRDGWTDHALGRVKRGVISRAMQKARNAYRQGTGAPWRVYSDNVRGARWIKGGKKAASVLGKVFALYDFYENTNGLADDLQNYLEHRREAEIAQEELDEIDAKIEDLLGEIKELRECLEKKSAPMVSHMKEHVPAAAAVTVSDEAYDSIVVDFDPGKENLQQAVAAAAVSDENGDAGRDDPGPTLERALADLEDIRMRMKDVMNNIEEVFIPLTPFLTDVWPGVEPEILSGLIQSGARKLESLQETLDDIRQDGRQLGETIENARDDF